MSTKTKSITLRSIDRKKFREWLAEHPRMQFHCRNNGKCPVARYTGRSTPGALALQEYSYAPWLVAFVRMVDTHGADIRLNGKEALALLDKVTA